MSFRHRPSLKASSLILAAGCLLLGPVPARADQVVYFLNGKAITVKKVEKGDKVTILEIEGGGRIGIPTVQIDRIEELSLSPTQLPPPQTQVTAILPVPPQPVADTAPAQPASTITPGPGMGGHSLAQNSAQKLAQPLAVGEDADAPRGPSDAPKAQAQAQGQTGSQAIPPGMMGPTMNRANMLGGPGSFQRRNNRQGNNNYGRGRLPAGAYLNPGASPQGTPANGAAGQQNGAPGQANGAAPPGGPGTQNGGNQQGNPPGQPGQPAETQPPAQPAPPPVVTPPPPPPSEPDPGEADANSDSSDDGSSASDDESSSGGDSGH